MKDFVLTGWVRTAGLVAATAGISAFFIPNPLPWMAAVAMSLAVSGALWTRLRAPRSLAHPIGLDAAPVRAVATRRLAPIDRKSRLRG